MDKNKKTALKIVYSYDELANRVEHVLKPLLKKYKIFAFSGTLGTGKTTCIKEILRQCGVTEPVTSPTFTYVNEYQNEKKERFFHFDLYRLGSLEEFLSAGFEEYFFQEESWVFIEWPEVIMTLLKKEGVRENVCFLQFEYFNEKEFSKRVFLISPSE